MIDLECCTQAANLCYINAPYMKQTEGLTLMRSVIAGESDLLAFSFISMSVSMQFKIYYFCSWHSLKDYEYCMENEEAYIPLLNSLRAHES